MSFSDEAAILSRGKVVKVPNGGKCLLCGKVYTTLGYAQRHFSMVHVDVGPRLNCNICNKTLKHEASLNHHLRIQHGIYQSGSGHLKENNVQVDVQIKEEVKYLKK